ncbi:hypothetical protein J7K27_08225 [Candidatus Bathyarchaeota archaeon]|nr:hypothetical protein [Candidatus Bathyarchaeota archaeon]
MSELIPPVLYQLGVGAICGFIIGFAIKKALKLLILLAGIFLSILVYLGYSGIITINFDKLFDAVKNLFDLGQQISGWLILIISTLPLTGSFIAGLILGFKVG